MARIGIVGSSFSEGNQPYTPWRSKGAKNTLRFQEHLKNHLPEHDFFNFAYSGQGSERFLENTLVLKDKYDIDILLIENIEDRSQNRVHYNLKEQWKILTDIQENPESRKFYAEKFSSGNYKHIWNSIYNNYFDPENTLLHDVPKRKVRNWIDVQSYIFYKDIMLKILGVKHIENTIKLCNFLNIKPVHWSQRHEACFLNDNGLGVRKYIENSWKGSWSKYTCDGTHCNDKAVDRLCKEYYKPILENVL